MEIEELYSLITDEVEVIGQIVQETVESSKIEQEKTITASITEKVELTSIIV